MKEPYKSDLLTLVRRSEHASTLARYGNIYDPQKSPTKEPYISRGRALCNPQKCPIRARLDAGARRQHHDLPPPLVADVGGPKASLRAPASGPGMCLSKEPYINQKEPYIIPKRDLLTVLLR